MPNKRLSTDLYTKSGKVKQNSLSKWDEAIAEAKARVIQLKQSIRLFESLRDSGMEFPEPKERSRRRKVAA